MITRYDPEHKCESIEKAQILIMAASFKGQCLKDFVPIEFQWTRRADGNVPYAHIEFFNDPVIDDDGTPGTLILHTVTVEKKDVHHVIEDMTLGECLFLIERNRAPGRYRQEWFQR